MAKALSLFRPLYHLTPPQGWMNDPNGFSYVGSRYELFYQYHELEGQGSTHLSWRLASSKDLVFYEDEGVKLSPRFSYEGIGEEGGGCFSGSRYRPKNVDYLLYAAASSRLGQSIALAEKDGSMYQQLPQNPIALPPAFVKEDSFRDPYCFSYEGHDYFIVGASSTLGNGLILLYELRGEKAFYRGIFFSDEEVSMFECPCLLFLHGKALLIVSPIGLGKEGSHHQSKSNNVYLIGHMGADGRFVKETGYIDLDDGFDYYAAQGINLPGSGKTAVLTAWLCLWNKEASLIPTKDKDGYLGAMALPRLLTIREGKLLQKPIPSLEKYLRIGKSETMEARESKAFSLSSHLRIESSNEALSLTFFPNSHGGVHLSYEPLRQEAVLVIQDERPESSLIYDGKERTIELQEGLRTIDVYADRYILELCFNDGEKWASLMYYPHLFESETAVMKVNAGHPYVREDVFEKN